MKSDLSTNEVDVWFAPGRFAVFLGVILFATFPEIFLGSHTCFYRDYLNLVHPYA